MIGSEYMMPDPNRDDKLDRRDELDEAVDVFTEQPYHVNWIAILGIIGSVVIVLAIVIGILH